ncbi:O-antigen ligase family protein [Phreatobacter stygius]|uniref:Polymerase n=1 Tax=Phreatobacter stygius TaxID=1940610 RepID=A0A4D7BCJ4_9HYPH|nr:O-antigen ligase family protein [Phreatobacter stygius]QCI68415.1 polymerase [Phreatobacter stygius]
MIRNAILAAGVVLSSASQLRIPGVPVGAGEICLALWIGLSISRIFIWGRVAANQSLRRLGMFWMLFALALSIGAVVSFLTDREIDFSTVTHDATAYLLMAMLTCLATAEPDGDARLRQIAWLLIAFANAGLAFQVAVGWGMLGSGTLSPWYWDRFRGWSENPNQTALYCAVMGPVAIHLGMTADKAIGRIAGFAGAVMPLVVGRLTKSDTFLLAMLCSGALLVGLQVRTWMAASSRSLRYAAAIFIVLAAPLSAIALLPYAVAVADEVESFALSLTKDKGGDATMQTANLRLDVWQGALRRGLETGSLGLGPGPHLDRPNIPNMQSLPMPFEAHNTLLDLYIQGGLIAVVAFGWLIVGTLILVLRARLDALAAVIGVLALFGISHFIFRHPIFWFAIALCVAEGCARAPMVRARYGR